MKNKIINWIMPFLMGICLLALPTVNALDFNQALSASDKATFDQMLAPLLKIYNFAKYAASAIAVMVLLFAGITYMLSGSNPKKRDDAKHMATYTIVGLLVIWIAPLAVNFVI